MVSSTSLQEQAQEKTINNQSFVIFVPASPLILSSLLEDDTRMWLMDEVVQGSDLLDFA